MAVGLCLLLPAAMAHNTSTFRSGGWSDGVSGNYVGPAGPVVGDSWAATYTAPFYAMACDLESDETNIDGSNNPRGWVGDGTWDDGGFGGACHTNSNTNPAFNTFGCQAGEQAFASDATGGSVFLAAACDWKEDQGGTSTELALALCMTNDALNLVEAAVDCGAQAVNCVLDPSCGVTGNVQICGADGVVDAANYGYGGGFLTAFSSAIFPVATGIFNSPPGWTAPCSASDEVAGVYVLSFVDTYSGSPSVYTPTTGWIDSGNPCLGCSFPPPLPLPPAPTLPPVSAIPLIPECMDGVDNDGDGTTDSSDPGCEGPTDTSERGTTACDDGVDNDGDGRTDYPSDPGCSSPMDNSETNPRPPGQAMGRA